MNALISAIATESHYRRLLVVLDYAVPVPTIGALYGYYWSSFWVLLYFP